MAMEEKAKVNMILNQARVNKFKFTKVERSNKMKTDLMQMENIAMEKARRMTDKESVKGREKTTTEKKMKERVKMMGREKEKMKEKVKITMEKEKAKKIRVTPKKVVRTMTKKRKPKEKRIGSQLKIQTKKIKNLRRKENKPMKNAMMERN